MSLLQSSHQSQLDRLSEYESSVREMRGAVHCCGCVGTRVSTSTSHYHQYRVSAGVEHSAAPGDPGSGTRTLAPAVVGLATHIASLPSSYLSIIRDIERHCLVACPRTPLACLSHSAHSHTCTSTTASFAVSRLIRRSVPAISAPATFPKCPKCRRIRFWPVHGLSLHRTIVLQRHHHQPYHH